MLAPKINIRLLAAAQDGSRTVASLTKADDLVYNMKHAPLTAENTSLNDPEFLVGETFNKTMAEMKEHLLLALSKRKEEALPAAVSIFNKIQEKEFKV